MAQIDFVLCGFKVFSSASCGSINLIDALFFIETERILSHNSGVLFFIRVDQWLIIPSTCLSYVASANRVE